MFEKRFEFPETVPLRYDDYGTIRVTGSRVTLDVLISRFELGDTLEEIHEGFPSVSLEQINAIIGWYLDNRAQVDEYIEEGRAEAEKVRQRIESRPESIAFNEKFRRLKEQRRREQLIKT